MKVSRSRQPFAIGRHDRPAFCANAAQCQQRIDERRPLHRLAILQAFEKFIESGYRS
jgi:hypothetical protein